MPLIYEARCSACDYVSPKHSEGYLTVIVDELSLSKHADPDDRRLVILGHPLESMILEELGFTDRTAGIGGRMLYIRNVVCRACGTMYEIRRLSAGSASLGGTGCLVMLGLSGGIGIYVGWQSESFLIGFIAGWLGIVTLFAAGDAVLALYVRWRHKDRVKEFDRGPGCPKCRSKKYASFPPRWGSLCCPECGQNSVRVRTVGLSQLPNQVLQLTAAHVAFPSCSAQRRPRRLSLVVEPVGKVQDAAE